MLKGVTFDLWFTLLPSTRELDASWRKARNREFYSILIEHGYLMDYREMKGRVKVFDESLQEQRRSQGIDVTNDEQIRRLIESVIQDGSNNQHLHARVKQIYTQPLLQNPPSYGTGVPELLATLKQEGWKIGLISNTGKTPGATFRQLFDRWNITQYFDNLTFSDEVQAYKPNPAIFRVAESSLQLKPEELIHVGDMISADVCGALEAGWQAMHFQQFIDLRYLDENARDAQVVGQCPPHEVAFSYPEVLEKLRAMKTRSAGAGTCKN